MLGFLFRGLTAAPSPGAALFDALTNEARRPHWFIEGKLPDTLDGRFAVVASLTALALARLEEDADANKLSVALTERFVEVMESEHRELGLGDPTLGKTVRKLVGMLGRRTELLRSAAAADLSWEEAVAQSLYKSPTDSDAVRHSTTEFERLFREFRKTDLASLERGKIA